MEQVLNIYYLTFDQLLCLNVWMEPVNFNILNSYPSRESIDEEDKCGGKLQIKNAYTNVTASPDGCILYRIPENWCELQDKILRVLTYKYYTSDYALHYYHHGSYIENGSVIPRHYDEEEMELCNLQEYADMSLPIIEVQVAHEILPIPLSPQNLTINDDKFWVKTWKLLKNIFTFKSCRY